MSSNIDITKPADNGLRLASDIRTLATTAKAEIEALQAQIGNGVGQGVSYFLTSTTSDTGTYDVMSRSPDNAAEVVESVVVNNNTATIDVYIAEALARTEIPAGEWSYDFFLYATPSTGVTYVTLEMYKRATGGAETLLFSVDSPEINNSVVANYNIKTIQQAFTVLTTDRLVLKVTATTNHNNDVTVALVHSGTDHYSHIVTPLTVETSQSIGTLIAGSGAKTTPVDADVLALSDSADGDKLKKFSFSNLTTWLASHFVKVVSNYAILAGTSTSGIKVGGVTPRLGSADLRGHFIVDTSGANAPVIATFDTNDEYLGYNASDKARWGFHVEHKDVASGVKSLHLHIKKARGSAVTAGTNLVVTAVVKHNYHNFDGQTPRGASPAPITLTFTITPAQLNAIPDGSTGIFQQNCFNEGGTGGLLNSLQLFIDDDINVNLTVTTLPTITGGATNRIAIHLVDFHREVNDGSGTYNADDIAGSFYL